MTWSLVQIYIAVALGGGNMQLAIYPHILTCQSSICGPLIGIRQRHTAIARILEGSWFPKKLLNIFPYLWMKKSSSVVAVILFYWIEWIFNDQRKGPQHLFRVLRGAVGQRERDLIIKMVDLQFLKSYELASSTTGNILCWKMLMRLLNTSIFHGFVLISILLDIISHTAIFPAWVISQLQNANVGFVSSCKSTFNAVFRLVHSIGLQLWCQHWEVSRSFQHVYLNNMKKILLFPMSCWTSMVILFLHLRVLNLDLPLKKESRKDVTKCRQPLRHIVDSMNCLMMSFVPICILMGKESMRTLWMEDMDLGFGAPLRLQWQWSSFKKRIFHCNHVKPTNWLGMQLARYMHWRPCMHCLLVASKGKYHVLRMCIIMHWEIDCTWKTRTSIYRMIGLLLNRSDLALGTLKSRWLCLCVNK